MITVDGLLLISIIGLAVGFLKDRQGIGLRWSIIKPWPVDKLLRPGLLQLKTASSEGLRYVRLPFVVLMLDKIEAGVIGVASVGG